MLFAAFIPFPVEGPYYFTLPADWAPNMITKIAVKILLASVARVASFKKAPADQNTTIYTKN